MPLHNYYLFVKKNFYFLGFGLLMTVGSSFGQTYFIAIFSSNLRLELNIAHGDFGLLYSVATLMSSATLIWLGKKIDEIYLSRFCLAVTIGLAVSCVILAYAQTVFVLGIAIFALRLTGQGLMSHAASTSMARQFSKNRGLALSISSAGLPIGEAIFPFITVSLLSIFHWRQVWLIIAAFVTIGITVLVQLALKKNHVNSISMSKDINFVVPTNKHQKQWTRMNVIKNSQFYQICLVALAPAFILTGLFFHQIYLAEFKGWTVKWLALCFVGFATSRLLASLFIGPLVDHISARKLLPWYLLPLGVGLIFLSYSTHNSVPLLFMILAGISTGSGSNINNALWAEIYGTRHLGSIKALITGIMVFSSALSPALLGWLIDTGISINIITFIMGIYVMFTCMNIYFRLKNS